MITIMVLQIARFISNIKEVIKRLNHLLVVIV